MFIMFFFSTHIAKRSFFFRYECMLMSRLCISITCQNLHLCLIVIIVVKTPSEKRKMFWQAFDLDVIGIGSSLYLPLCHWVRVLQSLLQNLNIPVGLVTVRAGTYLSDIWIFSLVTACGTMTVISLGYHLDKCWMMALVLMANMQMGQIRRNISKIS